MSNGVISASTASVRNFFSSLDDDSIPWKQLVQVLLVVVYLFENYLSLRQYRVYSYSAPPASLAQHVDIETFKKSQKYGKEKAGFAFVAAAWGLLNALAIVHFDAIPLIWGVAGHIITQFGLKPTEITQSIAFTLVFSAIRSTLDLPFEWYSHFVVEERAGFNKMTTSTFFLDFAKNLGVGAVLLSPLIAGLIAIIRWAGTDGFVFWVLVFMLGFQILAQVLYPTLIQPLFNKLTPLPTGPLKSRVVSLASSLKFPLAKIYQIDGSKRSAHSNAYFFGVLPWMGKHIVIYDTLMKSSTCSEIEAILGHELGHWHARDPTKLLVISQLQIGLTFALFGGFIGNASLFRSFGFHVTPSQPTTMPIIIGLELFQMVLSPSDSILKFVFNSLVRSMEYSADAFAAGLTRPDFSDEQMEELTQSIRNDTRRSNGSSESTDPGESQVNGHSLPENPDDRLQLELSQTSMPYDVLLAQALIKLHVQNLSSTHYDPLYSAYHHSHPTLPERLAALDKLRRDKEVQEKKGK